MKLHSSAVDTLLNLFDNFGGQVDHKLLRKKLLDLEFISYTRSTGEQDTVLVTAEEYTRVLRTLPK